MHVDVEALCGKRNGGERSPLVVSLRGGGLSFVLCVDRSLRHLGDFLFFLVAGDQSYGKKQGKAQNSADFRASNHPSRITGA